MILQYAYRMLREPAARPLARFVYNFGWKGMRSVNRFHRRIRRGEYFPAFLFLSVTSRCNLSCQGCWVTPTEAPDCMDLEAMDRIVSEAKRQGCYFFGLLGGEPLLNPDTFKLIERHPDCYFLLFTNGMLITELLAAEMRRLANVSPLISIEGREEVSGERRGDSQAYIRALHGLDLCTSHGLITGVATSVCQSNFDEVVRRAFVDDMIRRGVHYLWYYIYRPVGPRPTPELALSSAQIVALRRFLVETRCTAPIMIVDAYWDHEGRALCPAAVGIGHHIGPRGDVEPCPPLQFAVERIGKDSDLWRLFTKSDFLKGFRDLASSTTRGCIIMERPDLLTAFAREAGARDTSGRGRMHQEIGSMAPCASHHLPGQEIPEAHWLYRFAKKHWFFGFGAYG